jgi:hypothetical protein
MTVHELTPATLYDLVKDLPPEAFPADRYGKVRFNPDTQEWEDAQGVRIDGQAEAMAQRFITSCLLWLTRTASMVHVWLMPLNGTLATRVSTNLPSTPSMGPTTGPTLLEAVVERVKQERAATQFIPKI